MDVYTCVCACVCECVCVCVCARLFLECYLHDYCLRLLIISRSVPATRPVKTQQKRATAMRIANQPHAILISVQTGRAVVEGRRSRCLRDVGGSRGSYPEPPSLVPEVS
jgi:hypothetical protein